MSSLVFYTDETQVLVATDTLATYPDGQPFKFASKAFIVPHLRLVMAGVGTHGFLGRWFVHMSELLITKGIDNLNCHAPRALSSLWQGYKQELSIPDGITTTVYHFGFSEVTGFVHSYAYRSESNFNSERLEPYGLRFKPECQPPANYSLPADLVAMMNEQRAIQAAKPKEERLHIGGEIEVHHLSQHGFEVYTLHRFEDYTQVETAIYDNCRLLKERGEAH
jgi:hypothetical protein